MTGSLMHHLRFLALRAFRKRELVPLAPPLKAHRQAAPAWRQVRVVLRLLFAEAQASKAEHRGLPQSAEGCGVNAAGRAAHAVR